MDASINFNDSSNPIGDENFSGSLSDINSNSPEMHPTQNPLLIPVIIEEVLKQLNPNFEQMKTLRLVSKIWTETTQQFWRKSCAALVINPDPIRLLRNPTKKKGLTVSQLLTELQNLQSPFPLAHKTFSKYVLKDFTFDLQVWSQLGGQAALFRDTVGPLMTTLHLEKCFFRNTLLSQPTTCPLVQLIATMTPNLIHLTLTDVAKLNEKPEFDFDDSNDGLDSDSEEDTDDDEDYGIAEEEKTQDFVKPFIGNLRTLEVNCTQGNLMSLTELLALAPILEDIIAQGHTDLSLLRSIHKVRFGTMHEGSRALSGLKNVNLNFNTYVFLNDVWSTLIPPNGSPNGTQVPLQNLFLNLSGLPGHVGNFDAYINSFSGTLQTFKAFRPPSANFTQAYATFFQNVSLISLKEICLWGNITPNLGFLINTPNLEKLKIDFECFEYRDVIKESIQNRGQTWKYQKARQDLIARVDKNLMDNILCSKLEHFDVDYEFSEDSLKILEHWMPNLKILKTILNTTTISVACQAWHTMSELVCLHESQLENSSFIREEETAGLPLKHKICDLKNLEIFQFDAYCTESQLTDDAVFKGLLKMENLKFVQISVHTNMSSDAEQALRKSTNYCKIIRSGSNSSFNDDGEVSGPHNCQCDRCIFRRRAESDGFISSDDTDEDEFNYYVWKV